MTFSIQQVKGQFQLLDNDVLQKPLPWLLFKTITEVRCKLQLSWLVEAIIWMVTRGLLHMYMDIIQNVAFLIFLTFCPHSFSSLNWRELLVNSYQGEDVQKLYLWLCMAESESILLFSSFWNTMNLTWCFCAEQYKRCRKKRPLTFITIHRQKHF